MKISKNQKSILGFLMVLLVIWSCNDSKDPEPDTTIPSASFTFTSDDLSVVFTNTSKDADTYAWDFGDGENSTDASPTHVYAASGSFDVTLVATRANGEKDSKTETVTVVDVTKAGFTLAVSVLEVTFTNTSTDATSYAWDFGDDETSTDADPVHTYAKSGTYTVKLTATSAGGETNSVSQDVPVQAVPVAAFTTTIADLLVTFNNSSTDASSYSWDFGDGTSSTDEAPTHTYTAGGTYTVELTATGASGVNNTSNEITVVAKAAVASFTSAANALVVTFTNTSTDATAFTWNFGDGSALSTEESPTHTYAVTGTYDASLTVSGVNPAENTATESLSVAGVVKAGFNFSGAGLTITFTNTSTDAISYLWDFGDDTTSTEVSPSHTYSSAGTYIIKLTATGLGGTTDEKSTEQTVNN